jgi:hypothetical protein
MANRKARAAKPKTVIQKLVAFSYSRLNTYRQCPLKAKFLYIDKLKEPQGEALQRGSDIHKFAEDYVKGTIKKLPPELKIYKDDFKEIITAIKKKTITVDIECQWAFDKNWKSCEWFSEKAWCRMMLDLVYIPTKKPTELVIIDYKTGKMRPENKEQLDLYALGAFMKYPNVEKVTAEFWYLDADEWVEEIYTKKDISRLQKHWADETKKYLNDTKFPPRANNFCRWCDFRKDAQGLCKF